MFSSLELRPLFAPYLPAGMLQNRQDDAQIFLGPLAQLQQFLPARFPIVWHHVVSGSRPAEIPPFAPAPPVPYRTRTVDDGDDVEDGSAAVCGAALGVCHSLGEFIATVEAAQPVRVPGTAVLMTAQSTGRLLAIAHNIRHNKTLHKRVVVLTVANGAGPARPGRGAPVVQPLWHDMFNVRVRYAFMEDPNFPEALEQAREQGLELDAEDVTYFLGCETIIVTRRKGMAIWRGKAFVLMARNTVCVTAFFRLPPERVVELGVQVEM